MIIHQCIDKLVIEYPLNLRVYFNSDQSIKKSEILCSYQPSIFGSVVAHPDLDGEVSGSSPGHTNKVTLKMVFTAPQPVLVLISLCKMNALGIKRWRSYLIQ